MDYMDLLKEAILLALGFSICIAFLLTLMIRDRDDTASVLLKIFVTIFTIGFIFTMTAIVVCGNATGDVTTKTVDSSNLVRLDIPNGIYWTNIDGSFVLGCGSVNSDLSMSYTIQYLDNNSILHTKIIDSDAETLTVHNSDTIKVVFTYTEKFYLTGITCTYLSHIDVYCPLHTLNQTA